MDRTADRAEGHLAVIAAQLAAALEDAGCGVEVYFPNGWVLEHDSDFAPLRLYQPGPIARWLLSRASGRPIVTRLLELRIAQHRARRTGASVIVTSFLANAGEILLAVTRGNWLVYEFADGYYPEHHSVPHPAAEQLTRIASLCRRVGRARVSIAVNSERTHAAWVAAGVGLPSVLLDFVAAAQTERVPDARAPLGIAADARVLLHFGAVHSLRRPDAVWECFADDSTTPAAPEWHLLVGGALADVFLDWCARTNRSSRRVTAIGGYASEEQRRRMFSAADASVIAFAPDTAMDSGSLTDAVAFGLPVVASDRCRTGDTATRLGLGPTFDVESPASLAAALERAPRALEPAVIAAARTALSPEHRVRAHLHALGLSMPNEPTARSTR